MVLRLYDTRTQSLRDFTPRQPGRVGIYVCGPTVQSAPHIGHLRSALSYDLLRRWLEYRGLEVTLVRNVTDIDDKILANAAPPEPWWALAYRTELTFSAAYRAIGVLPPTAEPRATGHVDVMQRLIAVLVDSGHAYPAPDGSGDVYFDTAAFAEYGEFTRQATEDMVAADDADSRGKRDPRDFALWKGTKSDEPESASWPSPWGPGRPGWHIECSAMAERYLGPAFDIHGGGLDLRFPHHENEVAQSHAAGRPFARYWIHNGLVTVDGQKMSKSLGNSVLAADVLARVPGSVLRYALGAAHYRSSLDVHEGGLQAAAEALGRIERFVSRAADSGAAFDDAVAGGVPDAFAAAMDDDLAVPQALAVLHETVREGNAALDGGLTEVVADAARSVRAMVDVLGLDLAGTTPRSAETETLATLVERLLLERRTARERRDWAAADAVRDTLTAAGVQLEDGPAGTRWSLAEGGRHGG